MTTLPPNHQFGRPVVHKMCTTRSDHFAGVGKKVVIRSKTYDFTPLQARRISNALKYGARAAWMPLIVVAIVGCVAKNLPVTPQSASTESAILAGNAGGRITARAGFIQGQIARLSIIAKDRPETPLAAVAPHLETIGDEAASIKTDQADADAANVLERQQQTATISILAHKVEERDGWINELKIELKGEKSKWYSQIGRFVDGIFSTLGIGIKWLLYGSIAFWIIGQVVAVVVPAFFPASKIALGVSKFFTLGLPFSWLTPLIRRVFAGKAAS